MLQETHSGENTHNSWKYEWGNDTFWSGINNNSAGIIALKASGRDCTNNNELLHKIGVLQRYGMQLFLFTREL